MRSMVLLVVGGCLNQTTRLREVELSGEISAPEGASEGPLTVELQHAWSGEGALRHPLEPIESFSLDGPGPYSWTLLYPEEGGEGLVVYAWMDGDGDGALCSPEQEEEWAGLTEVQDFPAFSVVADLALDAACAGPEALYP